MRTDTAPLPPLWECTDEVPAQIESNLPGLCRPGGRRDPLLVVGKETKGLSRALASEGHAVVHCAGPNESCPLLRGERCRLRDEAGAAIVRVAPFEDEHGDRGSRLCAAAGASPGLLLLEGRADPLTRDGRLVWIGGLRGTDGVSAAVGRLLTRSGV